MILTLFSLTAFSARILQSKNNKVLIETDGEQLAVGQKLFLLNATGKKIAVASISQSKNNRAIAIVEKGTAEGASDIQLGPPVKKAKDEISFDEESSEQNTDESNENKTGVYRLNATKFSIMATLTFNSMSTLQSDGTQPTPNQETVKMSGMGFGLTGALDYPFNDWLTLRGTLGYEPFDAKGTAQFLSCDSLTSRNCTASLQYLAGGGYARFNFTKSKAQAWAGFGMSGKFPIAKTATAVRTDDIKFTATFAVVGGVDYYTGNNSFIPFSVEYQLFPNSDTVTANIILLRGGYGWAF